MVALSLETGKDNWYARMQAQVILHAAQAAVQAGQIDRAYELLLSVVDKDPANLELWFLLGWTAPSQKSALDHFYHALRLQPDNPLALDGLEWARTGWSDLRGKSKEVISPAPARFEALIAQATTAPPTVASSSAALASSATAVLIPEIAPPLSAEEYFTGRKVDLLGKLSFWLLRANPLAYLLAYLLGIAAAELVTTLINPQLGLAIHGILLVVIFLHGSLLAQGAERKFLLTLTLAPLIRLLSLSMPLFKFEFVTWYMIIGVPLLAAALVVMRLTGYKAKEVGLAWGTRLPLQVAVALSGIGLGYLEYQILQPVPLADSLSLEQIWMPALILAIFTGFLEELIFRGLMQRASIVVLNKLSFVYVSLLFAVLHIGYKSITDFVFVFLVGLFFSVVVKRTNSILGVTLAHSLTNITLFLIFPFL